MSDLRSKFEEIPEIKRMLGCDEILWDDTYKWYRTDNTDANSIYHLAWLNGAWFAFQERQKKIDAVLNHLAGCNHGLDVNINFIRGVLLND